MINLYHKFVPLVMWVQDRPVSSCVSLLGISIKNFSVAARILEVGRVTPPCFGKHIKPLVSAVIRTSLTVVTGCQKPEFNNQSYQEVSCCPVTGLWRSDIKTIFCTYSEQMLFRVWRFVYVSLCVCKRNTRHGEIPSFFLYIIEWQTSRRLT